VITALVLLNVEPGRVKSLAEELLAIEGVTEVYSVAGPYDLVALAFRLRIGIALPLARHGASVGCLCEGRRA